MTFGTEAAATGTARDAAVRGVRVSKLVPPVLPDGYVGRPALHDRLDEAFGRRLTTVEAGPGFGKSTLVAAWSADTVCAWCTLDRSDSSLPRLAASLGAALRQRLAWLADDFVAAAAQRVGEDEPDSSRVEAIAALLCESLEARVPSDVVLVLDDVHELEAGTASAHLIGALARQAPPELHLVLSSRTQAPFPIERLRGRGQVSEIGASMLAFTSDEIAELLSSSIGSMELAQEIHEITAGWPAGVRLAAESLRAVAVGDRRHALESLGRPEGPLFSYLAEEVFSNEPAAVQELLRTVAPLERVDAELCSDLGIPDAPALLAGLARRGLFVQREAGTAETFTIHALAREFAAERWPLAPTEARAVHLRAAARAVASGNLEAALRSLISAGDPAAVGRLVSERGDELLARAQATMCCRRRSSFPRACTTPGSQR
jgi:ATP/maltotriose-dependent transcriptional regulator MalT